MYDAERMAKATSPTSHRMAAHMSLYFEPDVAKVLAVFIACKGGGRPDFEEVEGWSTKGLVSCKTLYDGGRGFCMAAGTGVLAFLLCVHAAVSPLNLINKSSCYRLRHSGIYFDIVDVYISLYVGDMPTLCVDL
jgi:hypothetical protein